MATAPTDIQFSGFTKYLIQEGLLTESEATIHSQEAQKKNIPLLSYLVANKIVDSKAVATKASI
jgi:type IV pilus assembly protein PilB